LDSLQHIESIAVRLVESLGLFGIFLVLFAAMIIVFIPSEVAISFAGFVAAKGDLAIGGVIVASLAGVISGMAALYGLSRLIKTDLIQKGVDTYGKWVGAKREHLDNAHKKLRLYDNKVAFVGQLLPAIRFGVGVIAGIERLPFWRYLFYTGLAAALWVSGFALLGYWLEDGYREVLDAYESVLEIAALLLIVVIMGIVIHRRRQ
jgi:membrane protein DedA with SNARE-associated domain